MSCEAPVISEFDRRLAAALGGDRDECFRLVKEFRRLLMVVVKVYRDPKRTPKIPDEDLVEETLEDGALALATFTGKTAGALLAWLSGILGHKAHAAGRKYRRRRSGIEDTHPFWSIESRDVFDLNPVCQGR